MYFLIFKNDGEKISDDDYLVITGAVVDTVSVRHIETAIILAIMLIESVEVSRSTGR